MPYFSKGFSLVELLVSISIASLILGISIAGYKNFQESQKVKEVALKLQSDLRFAQSQAAGGVTFCTAGSMKGWFVDTSIGGSYTVGYYCDSTQTIKSTVPLTTGLTITATQSCVAFQPVSLGVSTCPPTGSSIGSPDQLVVRSTNSSKVSTITVSPSGDVQYAEN